LLFWLADDVKPGSQHHAGWQAYSLVPCNIFTSNVINLTAMVSFRQNIYIKQTKKMQGENK
jgi:hypothetical protein